MSQASFWGRRAPFRSWWSHTGDIKIAEGEVLRKAKQSGVMGFLFKTSSRYRESQNFKSVDEASEAVRLRRSLATMHLVMHGLGRGWKTALNGWIQGRKVWFPRKGLIAVKDEMQ